MSKYYKVFTLILLLVAQLSCGQQMAKTTVIGNTDPIDQDLLKEYVEKDDGAYQYEMVGTIPGEGFSTHVIRLQSQQWLTTAEVKDPIWWHWLTLTVPDGTEASTGMVIVGGGNRTREQPTQHDGMAVQIAMASNSMVAALHNVPNQPVEFLDDDYGPRVEDELIAYGWRQFLEGGAQMKDANWLARLPMTKSVVKAMDALQDYTQASDELTNLEDFVITGGSKRGWTTWTTGAIDDRVVAIAPIVIDMLNVVPSFNHHWRVYGFWAPAVGNYVEEGIMEWQNSQEYKRLLSLTEPYEFRDQLKLPKLILNSTGDQFFLPDSWQFYWNDLQGEKHMRYVPNTDHSMRDSDVLLTLTSFYEYILADVERPDFDWSVSDGTIQISTSDKHVPQKVTLWQATNEYGRDFRIETQGKLYEATDIPISADGNYSISAPTGAGGFTAYYVELTFPGLGEIPFKQSTGILVTPDTYAHDAYTSPDPKGTK